MKTISLSHSGVDKYITCPKSYEYHYLENLRPIKLGSALAFGGAIDKGLNELLVSRDLEKALNVFKSSWSLQDINNDKHVCLIESDLIKYSKNDLDETLLTKEELEGSNPHWISLEKKGILFITAYHIQIMPRIKRVIESQSAIEILNNEGDKITGFLDIIVEWEDGRIILMDNKTTTVKYAEGSAGESDQLALYHFAKKDEHKFDGVGYIVLNKSIKKTKIKTCEICSNVIEGSNIRTCPNVEDEIRCGGNFIISYEHDVDIEVHISEMSERKQSEVVEKFDIVLNAIHNEKFEKNTNSCRGKYGQCVFYNYCMYGRDDDLVKVIAKEKT